MLLYIMLYIMLAYLMLFVCIMHIYFLPLTFANALCFHALSLGYSHIVSLFKMLFYIICCDFSQLAFLTVCSHTVF